MVKPSQKAIGIFDSGLGGLTVVRAVQDRLPKERVVYLGDTARVPYGTKSPETVRRYALACARALLCHNLKVLVVACNTASAVALDALRVEYDLPVLGVIGPGARAAVAATRAGRIGVLATAATVEAGAYAQKVAAESTRVEVFQQAAPLLVPLVEEGWDTGEVPRLAAKRYLAPLVRRRIDAVVLGCTHYPMLRPVLEAELCALAGMEVPIVDSASALATELSALLEDRQLASHAREGSLALHVTDTPGAFEATATRFLGQQVGAGGVAVERIDL